jgi:acetyltransferase
VPARRIEAIFKPASIVLVGASDTPGTIGDVVRRNLHEAGFSGPLYFVNPRHETIDGQQVHASVRDLPAAPDLAVVVAPAAAVPDIIADCGEKGVRGAIIISAGFREGGAAGRELEADLKRRARQYGLRFLGPNSLGVIRTEGGLNAACGPGQPLPGRLALVSQSGALCAAILDWARARHVGFSTVISTGIGADIDFGEILDFLARNPATDSIMLYMEGVDNARRFISALRAASRMKPVVVMKAGRRGRPDVAAFHRALVGSDECSTAMRRAGVRASATSPTCTTPPQRLAPECGSRGADWPSSPMPAVPARSLPTMPRIADCSWPTSGRKRCSSFTPCCRRARIVVTRCMFAATPRPR